MQSTHTHASMHTHNVLARLDDLLLPDWFQYWDDTVGLHGGEHPVLGLVHVRHVDTQTAVLAQQNQSRTLAKMYQINSVPYVSVTILFKWNSYVYFYQIAVRKTYCKLLWRLGRSTKTLDVISTEITCVWQDHKWICAWIYQCIIWLMKWPRQHPISQSGWPRRIITLGKYWPKLIAESFAMWSQQKLMSESFTRVNKNFLPWSKMQNNSLTHDRRARHLTWSELDPMWRMATMSWIWNNQCIHSVEFLLYLAHLQSAKQSIVKVLDLNHHHQTLRARVS